LDGRLESDLTRDALLENISLYWLTNTGIRGGHFAAWEQPKILCEELRNAFRTLR